LFIEILFCVLNELDFSTIDSFNATDKVIFLLVDMEASIFVKLENLNTA
jgi:hypothetical protein